MDLSKARPGQVRAFNTLVGRIQSGEQYTTIVLPTRYGKSDVIRLAAWDLQQKGYIHTTVVLSPNQTLRNQMVAKDKLQPFLARYGIWNEFKVFTVERPGVNYGSNGEVVLSTTMQLFHSDLNNWLAWIDSVIAQTGRPPLIEIDEAHTGSEDNAWGGDVEKAVKAGAIAALWTATPFRSDGKLIPGFESEVLGEQEIRAYRRRPGQTVETVVIETYDATKRLVRLRAHHETSFKEAWLEKPSPLCKVTRLPFDVDLSRLENGTQTDGVMLSGLKDYEVRKNGILNKVTRDRAVIREGCERLVHELHTFRRNVEDCAAIVFCGNDTDTEKQSNQHAKLIRDTLEAIDSSLEVVIATSATDTEVDDTGNKRIESFKRGKGDVLIVKQMASVGLDIGRLKVGLDLSPIRTINAAIQRMMRIATVYGVVRHCVWITPDDCISQGIFEYMVSENGGAEWRTSLGDLLGTEERERDERELGPLFSVNGVIGADFEDNNRNYAEAERLPEVRELLDMYPELTSLLSHSEIATRFATRGITFTIPAGPQVRDVSSENEDLRKDINDLVSDLIKLRMHGRAYDAALWRAYSQEGFTAAYRAAGVQPGMTLDRITNTETLRRVKQTLERFKVGVPSGAA